MHLSVEGLHPWDWSYPVLQYLREWPTPTVVSSLSQVLSLNTNQPGFLEIGPMHLSVEGLRPWDWSYPVLQYLREWPTPTVVSSLSQVLSLNTNQPGFLEIGPMHLSVEGLRPWDWSYPVLQYLREWPTPTVVSSLSQVLSLNTNQPGFLEIGPMHLSVEGLRPWDWSYPVLQYLREWHSDSRIVFVTGTVVKHQPKKKVFYVGNTRQQSEVLYGFWLSMVLEMGLIVGSLAFFIATSLTDAGEWNWRMQRKFST